MSLASKGVALRFSQRLEIKNSLTSLSCWCFLVFIPLFFFCSWKAGRINPVQSTNSHFRSWGLFSFFEGECIIHHKHIHGVRSATDFEWSSWWCCNYDGAWNISNKYRTIFLQQHEFLDLYDPWRGESARVYSSQEIGHHRVTIFLVRKTAKKGLKR